MKRLAIVGGVGALLAAAGLAIPLLAAAPTKPVVRPITGLVKTPPKPVLNPVPLYVKVDPATLAVDQQKAIQKIQTETNASMTRLLAEEHARVLAVLSEKQKALLTKPDMSDNLDSLNDMSEMTSMRLQMAMDRRSKFIEALSNILKKISDTDSSVIQNMK